MPEAFADLAELMREDQETASERREHELSERRHRRRRGLIVTASVFGVLLLLTGGYTGWALTAPLPEPVEISAAPLAPTGAAAALAAVRGSSALSISGADDYLGPAASGVFSASGSADAQSIASIAKLITALVILDAKPLASADDPGPTITFGKAAHDLYDKYYVMGATVARMPTGTTMSQRDALATMLIPSACNYAEATSTWAFGSQRAFLEATRRWLDAHGLSGTTIVEPTGIDPRNTSTPADLIAIGKLAAANATIAKIASTRSLEVPVIGTITNTNSVLGMGGITGLKTGNLGQGAFNLLYTASFTVAPGKQLDVTGIVLGGLSRDSVGLSVVALLDSIRAGFHDVALAEAGQQVGTYSTPWGASARLVLADAPSIFTWSDTPIEVSMTTTAPETYEDGAIVGEVTWTAGPHTASAPVEIDGTIEPPDEWWRLTHPGDLG